MGVPMPSLLRGRGFWLVGPEPGTRAGFWAADSDVGAMLTHLLDRPGAFQRHDVDLGPNGLGLELGPPPVAAAPSVGEMSTDAPEEVAGGLSGGALGEGIQQEEGEEEEELVGDESASWHDEAEPPSDRMSLGSDGDGPGAGEPPRAPGLPRHVGARRVRATLGHATRCPR